MPDESLFARIEIIVQVNKHALGFNVYLFFGSQTFLGTNQARVPEVSAVLILGHVNPAFDSQNVQEF